MSLGKYFKRQIFRRLNFQMINLKSLEMYIPKHPLYKYIKIH